MTDQFNQEVDPYLLQLVFSLEAAAMQQLGKLQNPMTGKVERDIELAKATIDMLGMVEKKTAGNLTPDEDRLVKHALYQLRMNYLDELRTDKDKPSTEGEAPSTQGSASSEAESDNPTN
jgi:hypothetical protein